ncbi:MAG: FixH family protein [Proteobacteria bacterium]|nr:FixH family protein [Pseudomonadota bacterium]MBU1737893.1 FixH family protein [Pseudomonadota bacterium]
MNKDRGKTTNVWPFLVIFIGISFLGVTGWSIYRATLGVSPVTDPEYYSHGLKYNQSNIEIKAAEASGWALSTVLKGQELVVNLVTHSGQAVTGCKGDIIIYSNSNARRLELELVEQSPGRYSMLFPENLTGSITGDLSLHREGARITRRLIVNL